MSNVENLLENLRNLRNVSELKKICRNIRYRKIEKLTSIADTILENRIPLRLSEYPWMRSVVQASDTPEKYGNVYHLLTDNQKNNLSYEQQKYFFEQHIYMGLYHSSQKNFDKFCDDLHHIYETLPINPGCSVYLFLGYVFQFVSCSDERLDVLYDTFKVLNLGVVTYNYDAIVTKELEIIC